MMKTQKKWPRLLGWQVCLPLLFIAPASALPPPPSLAPFSNNPLFLGGNIPPNVMFTLDDSGSMQWEMMPEDITFFDYLFPRPGGLYGGLTYANQVPDFNPANQFNRLARSPGVNKIYYNPAVTYKPWVQSNGALMANANITCAPHNPILTGLGCRNMTVNQTFNMTGGSNLWHDGAGWYTGNHNFYPSVYYRYAGGDIYLAANYTQVQIISTTPTYTGDGRSSRTDCATAGTCTYAEEIQNFANWYTYYRSRILLARAGVGAAFAAQGENMRVGFAAINKGNSTIDGVANIGAVTRGVRPFTAGPGRDDFFTALYGRVINRLGTPLRVAVRRVGEYYERTDDLGPWGEFPGTGGGAQHECRKSYNILTTDGYWNDSESLVGDSDGSTGSTIVNHSSPASPADFTYVATAPYTDTFSDSLADYAMHYWKRDLRPDLDNKVPSDPIIDPAFWQHVVTYTVGLGVFGTLPPPPAAPGPWPNPFAGNPEKIDDLWHAAVNGRGLFFSAANPAQFETGLSGALSDIQARTGSASAVATNSTQLDTDGRIYQAKFNNDWSGNLLSIEVDVNGNFGATVWEAGTVINSQTPASRVILTKGATDGVAFTYADLSTPQKAELDKNASSVTDNCGPERVAYLRGDAIQEATGGTFTCASASVVNNFRVRATSKLGDIIHSSPVYVGDPTAGLSDVDHPGYSAFADSTSGYKNRKPMIYVGANDGSLHGFDACISGVGTCTAADGGKELLAYVPSMVYMSLSRLTDRDYNINHRYLVDGSPMVADANFGTALAPDWKSVLVGSMNGGGQGFFALDVTNPADALKPAPTFAVSNAAQLVLWEFNNGDDADVGYTHTIPVIDRFTNQALQITKMENGKWAAILGNGYNSTAGKAVLYVLFLNGGLDGVWTPDTDFVKIVADVGTGNGLATPVPFDADGNGLADTIYAGDLKGNMWKFDVSNPVASSANWIVDLGGAALFSTGVATKNITSPPVITTHPDGGQLVIFGTGKYLQTSDVATVDVQSMYGVWDVGVPVAAAELVLQTGTSGGITTSQNPVDYEAVTAPLVKGWQLDFPDSGERFTAFPRLENGIVTFVSIIPTVNPCDGGGEGYAYNLDYLTGGMLSSAVFDTDGDGDVDGNDSASARIDIGFSPGGVTRIGTKSGDILVSSKSDGTLKKTDNPQSNLSDVGRVNWRELIR
jgi:type IV pilus assembly protein PilY1